MADAEDGTARPSVELREREERFGQATKQLAGARQELEQVRAEHERRKHEIEEAKKHFESLQKRIADSIKALPPGAQATDDEKLAELWSPVLDKPRGRGGPSDELQALRRTQEYLRALGLHFPERTLRAFHTSLKVGRLSPWSSSPASAAPEKSSCPAVRGRAGHPLPELAVQPRWDSPEDLSDSTTTWRTATGRPSSVGPGVRHGRPLRCDDRPRLAIPEGVGRAQRR